MDDQHTVITVVVLVAAFVCVVGLSVCSNTAKKLSPKRKHCWHWTKGSLKYYCCCFCSTEHNGYSPAPSAPPSPRSPRSDGAFAVTISPDAQCPLTPKRLQRIVNWLHGVVPVLDEEEEPSTAPRSTASDKDNPSFDGRGCLQYCGDDGVLTSRASSQGQLSPRVSERSPRSQRKGS
eukprot:PhF_6_TR4310/c0_g2_i1/m.5814